MPLSLSEQLVLGILAERQRHGYDIEKLIDEREMRKWTDIGFSSIYYVLDRLETKGLASSGKAKGKARKLYSVTPKGISTLMRSARALIAERRPANTHMMTGLAASDHIEGAELVRALSERRQRLASDLAGVCDKQSALKAAPPAARRLLSLSKALIEAEIEWISDEIERTAS